jgi:hypothetical protein
MYIEMEIEPEASGGGAGSRLTPELYRAALRWAIAEVQRRPSKTAATRDVAAMFSEEFETPFLIDIRHPEHYNRLRRPGFSPAGPAHGFLRYWQDAAVILSDQTRGLLMFFLRYLAGGASPDNPPGPSLTGYSTPGITMVTTLSGSRLNYGPHEHGQLVTSKKDRVVLLARYGGFTFSGRASVVFGGVGIHSRDVYRDDGFTKTVVHEMGHILLLRHQFDSQAPSRYREDHDSSTRVVAPALVPSPVPYDRCLMGYAPCEGELCGKCHLKLRGWDISRMPTS